MRITVTDTEIELMRDLIERHEQRADFDVAEACEDCPRRWEVAFKCVRSEGPNGLPLEKCPYKDDP